MTGQSYDTGLPAEKQWGNQMSPWQQLAPEETESLSSKCWGKITGCLKSISSKTSLQGIPRNQSGKESSWQGRRCRRHRFSPQVGKICQRRRWRPTPVFLSGGSRGQRSLMGYGPGGHEESRLSTQHTYLHANQHPGDERKHTQRLR